MTNMFHCVRVYLVLPDSGLYGQQTIGYREFIAATVLLYKLEHEEHVVETFTYFDKDRSSYIKSMNSTISWVINTQF